MTAEAEWRFVTWALFMSLPSKQSRLPYSSYPSHVQYSSAYEETNLVAVLQTEHQPQVRDTGNCAPQTPTWLKGEWLRIAQQLGGGSLAQVCSYVKLQQVLHLLILCWAESTLAVMGSLQY